MKLPQIIVATLRDRLLERARAEPDFVIGPRAAPYLKRWWIIPRNRFFNIYLHHFLHSDEDRALHDHPWWNVSLILVGGYAEHTIAAGGVNHRRRFVAGELRLRGARTAHRVELDNGPCWTLFVTGPVIREWGFHCVRGWRHWKDFVDQRDSGQVGRGCE